MFIGHFAVGYASKRLAPRTSLGWLLAAPLVLDLAWPVLCLAGAETFRIVPGETPYLRLAFDHYPWSHSLLMALAWSAAYALLVRVATGDARAAAVCAAGVASHWVMDALVHVPDLPLAPGLDARVGLSLWRSVPATLALELALFAAGVAIYARSTRARDAIGRWAFAAQVAVLLAFYAASVAGPPPPSVSAVPYGTLAMVLFVPWAWWFDAHRGSA